MLPLTNRVYRKLAADSSRSGIRVENLPIQVGMDGSDYIGIISGFFKMGEYHHICDPGHSLPIGPILRCMDFNSQKAMLVGEFWRLKSTHLKVAQIAKHCSRIVWYWFCLKLSI